VLLIDDEIITGFAEPAAGRPRTGTTPDILPSLQPPRYLPWADMVTRAIKEA
jgi:hypothetical protein